MPRKTIAEVMLVLCMILQTLLGSCLGCPCRWVADSASGGVRPSFDATGPTAGKNPAEDGQPADVRGDQADSCSYWLYRELPGNGLPTPERMPRKTCCEIHAAEHGLSSFRIHVSIAWRDLSTTETTYLGDLTRSRLDMPVPTLPTRPNLFALQCLRL